MPGFPAGAAPRSCVMLDQCGMPPRKISTVSRRCLLNYSGDLYADVRLDTEFERLKVTSADDRAVFLSRVRRALR